MPLPELRRELRGRIDEFDRVLRGLDSYRSLVRASLYRHRIRCGHPGCRCARGAGHPRWCLSFSSARGRHTRTLSAEELRQVTPAAEAYRRYRRVRARAARLVQQIFRLIDRIQKGLERPISRVLTGRR